MGYKRPNLVNLAYHQVQRKVQSANDMRSYNNCHLNFQLAPLKHPTKLEREEKQKNYCHRAVMK